MQEHLGPRSGPSPTRPAVTVEPLAERPLLDWRLVGAAAVLAVALAAGVIGACLAAGPRALPWEVTALAPPDVPPAVDMEVPPPAPPAPPPPSMPRATDLAPPPAARAPEPAPPGGPVPFIFKRRTHADAEEMARRLMGAPEVSLEKGGENALARQLVRHAGARTSRFVHPVFDVLTERADLLGLPLRMGVDCQSSKEAAESLQALSRKLRLHLIEAARRDPLDLRLKPEAVRSVLMTAPPGQHPQWLEEEAVPTLDQMLQVEARGPRLALVEALARIPGTAATAALARRALFDLSEGVREAAVRALADRPRGAYRALLLAGLRYPWAPAADHAAEALVALRDREAVPVLVGLLKEPDPRLEVRASGPLDLGPHMYKAPRLGPLGGKVVMAVEEGRTGSRTVSVLGSEDVAEPREKSVLVVRELVRVNHLRNCMLCHAPALAATDPVAGLVPTPNEPLPPPSQPYYSGSPGGIFVRADVTYLRQDFALALPVERPGAWPAHQRFDYLVRTRHATDEERAAWEKRKARPAAYPQRESVLFALRGLTGRDGGSSPERWRAVLDLPQED